MINSLRTVTVGNLTPYELRPPKAGRTYLEIYVDDAAAIRYAEGTLADSVNGFPIAPNTSKSWGTGGQAPSAVPQGNIWLIGTVAGPQRVIIKET